MPFDSRVDTVDVTLHCLCPSSCKSIGFNAAPAMGAMEAD